MNYYEMEAAHEDFMSAYDAIHERYAGSEVDPAYEAECDYPFHVLRHANGKAYGFLVTPENVRVTYTEKDTHWVKEMTPTVARRLWATLAKGGYAR